MNMSVYKLFECICIFVCMCMSICVYMCRDVYVYICAHLCIFMCTSLMKPSIYLNMRVCINENVLTYTCKYADLYVHCRVCTYIYMCIYVFVEKLISVDVKRVNMAHIYIQMFVCIETHVLLYMSSCIRVNM